MSFVFFLSNEKHKSILIKIQLQTMKSMKSEKLLKKQIKRKLNLMNLMR